MQQAKGGGARKQVRSGEGGAGRSVTPAQQPFAHQRRERRISAHWLISMLLLTVQMVGDRDNIPEPSKCF